MSLLTLRRLEVANAHFVTPWLLTGGDLHHDVPRALDQLDELVGAGVTHIIDNRRGFSDERLVADHAPHVGYLHNGVDEQERRVQRRRLAEWRAANWIHVVRIIRDIRSGEGSEI